MNMANESHKIYFFIVLLSFNLIIYFFLLHSSTDETSRSINRSSKSSTDKMSRSINQSSKVPQNLYEPCQIVENIYFIGSWKNDPRKYSVYIINTTKGVVLIDAGCSKNLKLLLEDLDKLGIKPDDIKYVLNTHAHGDHTGGDEFFQDAGAKICINSQDAESLQYGDEKMFCRYCCKKNLRTVTPDCILNDGDILDFGEKIKVIHFPGHTEGGLVYLIERKTPNGTAKIYFAGDTILGKNWYSHWAGNAYSNKTQFINSLMRLHNATENDAENTEYYIAGGHASLNNEWSNNFINKTNFRNNLLEIQKLITKQKLDDNSDFF